MLTSSPSAAALPIAYFVLRILVVLNWLMAVMIVRSSPGHSLHRPARGSIGELAQ